MTGWKKILHGADTKRKLGKLLISEKIHFKTETEVRDKEGHCIRIKESIQQEDIKFVNFYAPNIGAPEQIKVTLIDSNRIGSNTVLVGDLIFHFHQGTCYLNRKSTRKH